MMTSDEFRAWSQRLQFSKETEALIAAIRSSSPVRHVTGPANNVTGRYPSSKMECSIQFESQHVELWAIYAMERDNDVLECYDQAPHILLSCRAKSGGQTTRWRTRDFFVSRRESAAWEEWKPAGCSFTRNIELLSSQMGAASGFHVECPKCLAVREIHPEGDRGTFSWHVKRVINTPNHVLRWMRRGNLWVTLRHKWEGR